MLKSDVIEVGKYVDLIANLSSNEWNLSRKASLTALSLPRQE